MARIVVSTHSRPKAAGHAASNIDIPLTSFNTQPPEGGWNPFAACCFSLLSFNTQPPEGGWAAPYGKQVAKLGFNTQPPEGGWSLS